MEEPKNGSGSARAEQSRAERASRSCFAIKCFQVCYASAAWPAFAFAFAVVVAAVPALICAWVLIVFLQVSSCSLSSRHFLSSISHRTRPGQARHPIRIPLDLVCSAHHLVRVLYAVACVRFTKPRTRPKHPLPNPDRYQHRSIADAKPTLDTDLRCTTHNTTHTTHSSYTAVAVCTVFCDLHI